MSDRSAIEWTDASWNPLRARRKATCKNDPGGEVGWYCEHVSEGCRNCYAEGFNRRLGTTLDYKPAHRDKIELYLGDKTLLAPLRWRKPRRIFVGSMTDLFGDWVTDEQLDKIFAVMALCPQHTFQVLTKRAARMRGYVAAQDRFKRTIAARGDIFNLWKTDKDNGANNEWPLPNVWLGVSCEDQATADERIPLLLDTPAAVRFISAEPLLGPIDLVKFLPPRISAEHQSQLADLVERYGTETIVDAVRDLGPGPSFLDWVIVGGESGPNARPMHPDWARSLRDQCAAAGVAFFFKQWGEWLPGEANHGQFDPRPMHAYRRCDNHSYQWPPGHPEVCNFGTHEDRFSGDLTTRRVGKKRAGRLLDGVEHSEFPSVSA